MEKSKIVLEKIEYKKIEKRSGNKLNMPEKKSRQIKSKLSNRNTVSNEQDLIDFTSEANQNVGKIYTKTITMAGDRNQQTAEDEDLTIPKACKLSTVFSEDEKKCDSDDLSFVLNRTHSSTRPTNASISSFSSQTSFGFVESVCSIQEYKYKLKEGSNSNLKELDADSENKMMSLKSVESFPNEYITQKDIPSIPQRAYNTMSVRNSVGKKRSFPRTKHFSNANIKIDSCENSKREFKRCASQKDNLSTLQNVYGKMTDRNSAGEKRLVAEDDGKVDNSENSVQMQDSTSLLCEEKDQIQELKDALEKSTNCLVKCFESCLNKTQKQEQLSLREDYSITKSDHDVSECKDDKKDFKILDRKRDALISDTSLSTFHDLENNSVTSAKQKICSEVCLIRSSNSKSIYTETTKSTNCPCDCCNGRCLHFQSTRRSLNRDLVRERQKSKKKNISSASKGDFSDNQTALNAILKEFRSRSKNKKRYLPPSPDKPTTARKVTDSVEDENISFRLVDRPNAGDNQIVEGWLSSTEKSNRIEKEKNQEYGLKRKNKSKIVEIYQKNDQLEKHEEDGISKDNQVSGHPNMILFFTFLFVICVFFCFLFLMFIFI